jgi:malonyl-CoA O-methyltransferase
MGTLTPRTAYDVWAETYPAFAHNPLMRAEQAIVEPLLLRLRARRALDVGTGTGRYLPILASTGAIVIGVDRSWAMLSCIGAELARPEAGHAQDGAADAEGGASSAPAVCGDAIHLPFRRGTFDLINASLMVGDVADLHAWAREMARALALGGHLVYSDFHPSWTEHGWRRTFRSADGRAHEVAFEPHTIDQHLSAIRGAGLRVEAIREPRLNADGDPSIRAFRKRWGNPPIVVIFHAIKEP